MNINGHKKKLKQIARTIKKIMAKSHLSLTDKARLKELNLARIKQRDKIKELESKVDHKQKRRHRKKRTQKKRR